MKGLETSSMASTSADLSADGTSTIGRVTSRSSTDSIILQRLIKCGVPAEYVERGKAGVADYVTVDILRLPEVINALLPGPDDVQASSWSRTVVDAQRPGTMKELQILYRDALEWVKWALFQGEPHTVLAGAGQVHGGPTGVCGAIFANNESAYRCRTCEYCPESRICVTCFQHGNHATHDYSNIAFVEGRCDCGDITSLKEPGFCSRHCGPGKGAPLPRFIVESASPVLEALLHYWVYRLRAGELSEYKLKKKVAFQLSAACIDMLLDFCNYGEAMLVFTAECVGNKTIGLLGTLMSTEYLPKAVDELLYKLLGHTNFKRVFAETYTSHYPKFYRGGNCSTNCRQESWKNFAAEVFTVKTLTSVLVMEFELLDILLETFNQFLCDCVGEDGLLVVDNYPISLQLYSGITADIKHVMSHVEVAHFVAEKRPELAAAWLDLVAFVQRSIHMGKQYRYWASAYFLEYHMANIHPLFIAGSTASDNPNAYFKQLSLSKDSGEKFEAAATGVGMCDNSSSTPVSVGCILREPDEVAAGTNSGGGPESDSKRCDVTISVDATECPPREGSLHEGDKQESSAISFARIPIPASLVRLITECTQVLNTNIMLDLGSRSTKSKQLGVDPGQVLAQGRRTKWRRRGMRSPPIQNSVVSFVIPLHRMLGLLLHKVLELHSVESETPAGSAGSDGHDEKLLAQMFHPLRVADVMEHPLRLQVLCGEVEAGIQDNDSPAYFLYDRYRSQDWCEDWLGLDLFLLQCCSVLAPPEEFVEEIQAQFSLSNYFTLVLWHPDEYPEKSDSVILAQKLLVLFIKLVSERGFCGLTEVEALRRELVQRLASKAIIKHSDLLQELPPRLRNSKHLQECLDAVATKGENFVHDDPAYALRQECWHELDLYHPRWNSEDKYFAQKRYLEACKAPAVLMQLPRWKPPFKQLQSMGRFIVCAQVHDILRCVFFQAAFAPNRGSQAAEKLLITALHLLALALDFCAAGQNTARLESKDVQCPATTVTLVDLITPSYGINNGTGGGAQGQPPLLQLATWRLPVRRADGTTMSEHQSMLSLLVLLLHNNFTVDYAAGAEAGLYTVSELIQNLLRKFARLKRGCMIQIQSIAPEVLILHPLKPFEIEEHTMESTIESFASLIRTVEEEVKHVNVNLKQCERLSLVFHDIGTFFQDMKKNMHWVEIKTVGPLFYEIKRVIRNGHILILAYSKDNWYKSVVAWGVNWEAFKDIHAELQGCIESFHLAFPELEYSSKCFRALLQRTWTEDLMTDAKLDHAGILVKLKMERRLKGYLQDSKNHENEDQDMRLLAATKTAKENEEIKVTGKEAYYLQINSSDIIIGKRIGEGAYGEVHEATWLDCKFAVKLLQTKDVSALQREVGILSKLRHPHVIQLVGFSVAEEKSMILMERMDGDLRHVIEKRDQKPPFAMKMAVQILCEIAAGMAYLHNQEVFHGDLKASNVLVNFKGSGGDFDVKISDFGVSQQIKLQKRHSDPGTGGLDTKTFSHERSHVYSGSSFSGIVGTTCWRAPEVFPSMSERQENPSSSRPFPKSEPTYTAKADVYSYAMTCYEVLTGLIPFANFKRSTVYAIVRRGDRPDLPLNLPTSLSSLIGACWDTDPERRPTFTTICKELRKIEQSIISSKFSTRCFNSYRRSCIIS